MFKTTFGPTMRILSSSPIPTKLIPLRRTKDPLKSSASAEHYLLPSGSTFIVRSPPSVIPPSIPIPQNAKGATHAYEHQLPPSRRLRSGDTQEKKFLSVSDVEELQTLRKSDPAYWTRKRLAEKFGVNDSKVIGTIGWGKDSEARRIQKERKMTLEAERESIESRWGWKKTIAREERRRRRSLW